MKKLLIVVGVLLTTSVYSQTRVDQHIHTDSSLSVVGKEELVKIYISQVNNLVEKLPYCVWGYGDDLHGVDIPKKSKYLGRKLKNMTVITEMYTDDNNVHMPEVVHYADKKRLVNVILYLQEINSKIIRVE
jgi:hypothetical protein